ncbi:MAG: hypothetical protein U0575_08800 [Phycisphaerales bacterium]
MKRMKRSSITVLVAFVLALLASPATRAEVFVVDKTIAIGDLAYDGQDIVVRGCTVTINGAHSFKSLTIEHSASGAKGVVTHAAGLAAGMWLTVDGDVFVTGAIGAWPACEINVSGRGDGSAQGQGAGASTPNYSAGAAGGGHGGGGGNSVNGPAGGTAYGAVGPSGFVDQPTTKGSGGGACTYYGIAGGAGGGVVRLTVAGTLTVDGTIASDGLAGGLYSGTSSGGGSGGSVWIECGGLYGAGTIRASGGPSGDPAKAGGGGGGRVAVYAGASGFPDTNIQARGGDGWSRGGAGTVWLHANGSALPTLIVDNGGFASETTEFTGDVTLDADVLVRNGGRLGPAHGDASMHLTVLGDVHVLAGGEIYASGRGDGSAQGQGAGASTPNYGVGAAGGGHGGGGGNSSNGAAGGGAYGTVAQPTTKGSGGGACTYYGIAGGAGGGVVRLTVAGTLTVDGTIASDGLAGGLYSGTSSGGGSGGSIWIGCDGLYGTGTIRADGGAGGSPTKAGGGGGGRIAIYTCAVGLPIAQIHSNGGAGYQTGGVGTKYIFSPSIDFQAMPTSTYVAEGGDVVLSAQATGDGLYAVKWFFDGEPLNDGPGVSGTSTQTLSLSGVKCVDRAGDYRIAVFDSCGFAFSLDAHLTVEVTGDLNGDCLVNGADLGQLLSSFGACTACAGDIDGNGTVDGGDLGILLAGWTG